MAKILDTVSVISPLFIVYRVALGRAMSSTLRPLEQVTDPIRFNVSLSNPFSQGEV